MKLTKEASDQFEQWKHEQAMLEEQGKQAKAAQGLNYDAFVLHIDGAKTMKELIERIDEYDPYNYQIIFVYDANSLWYGVKVRVQFYKGQSIYTVPKDSIGTIYVPISTHLIRNKMFTVLRNIKKQKEL